MKTKHLSFLCLLLISNTYCISAQDKKIISSKLNEATVFFRGAELSHSASSPLVSGENEIHIEGLSPNIDRNSLKIKTTNGVIVTAYEFTVDYLSGSKKTAPALKRLQDSVLIYEKRLEQINTEINITKDLQSFLQKGMDKNISGSEKGLGIDELVKTMDYYKNKAKELQNTQSDNNRKKEEAEIALKQLKQQLEQESVKNNKTSGILKLTLSSPVTNTCRFNISYYTPLAGWTPYYEMNITSTDKPVQIISKSKVRQTTGLDWEKIKLALSTSAPSNGKTAPLFNAWFLDFSRPLHARKEMMLQNSFSYERAEVLPVEEATVEDDQEIQYTASTINDYITPYESELNMVYTIDIPYNIPGNGKEQNINLQTKEANAEYKYYCAPKLDTETYLLAEIPDWQRLNLMSAPVNITYDGTYVGESYIDAGSTHEKLALTLGSDKRVSVKREKMHDYSTTKFIGSDKKQEFIYKLTVRNNQNKPVKMVLKDQYPISTQKNIVVELLSKNTTPWTAHVESLGVITWEEELQPGETKEYRIGYSVKYPKDSNINL